MAHTHGSLAHETDLDGIPSPVMVEVTRSDDVESRHRAAAVIVTAEGNIVEAWGDPALQVFPRSAIKPIQAMPLILSGAADAFNLSEAELTIACGSHNGEPAHVELVDKWLKRIGCTPADLGCGGHLPYHASSAEALLRQGGTPSRLHDNCSGKHAGFLTLARHLGVPVQGYLKPDHPVQQEVMKAMAFMTGFPPAATASGVDGCGIPAYAFPLHALAWSIARFGAPETLPATYAAAATRLAQAITHAPWYIAGTSRFCTVAMEALKGRVIVKTGAEGVFMAAFPAKKLGVALKIRDGAARAAEVLMAGLIRRIEGIDLAAYPALNELSSPTLRTRTGEPTGLIRLAADAGI